MRTETAQISIDSDFHELLVPLTAEERAGLEKSLLAEGCRDPLVIWAGHGILLDGHNRLPICQEHDIPYETVEIELPDRAAAKIWIIRNQLARRNLSNYQKAELGFKLEELIESHQGERTDLGQNSDRSSDRPSQQAADAVGISRDTLHRAKYIHDRADEDTKQKLRRGETSVNREYERLRREEKRQERDRAKLEREKSERTVEPLVCHASWRECLPGQPACNCS